MLPRMLATASLRHTSRLRRHTGRKRADSTGIRSVDEAFIRSPGSGTARMRGARECWKCPSSVAQFAPGELDEQVFEVGGAVQVAQAAAGREIGEQRRGVARVAECGVAREL